MQNNPNFNNVIDYGATPDDGTDDTDAFKAAIAAGGTVYVPEGEFIITDTLSIRSGNLVGAGPEKSIITADISDVKAPIIEAMRTANIQNLHLRFKDGLVTGSEKQWDRIAILTGGELTLQRGSTLENLRITNAGTGIASPLAASSPKYKNSKIESFSVTYNNIEITDFSYRGFDFASAFRTGNVYRNIVLSSGKYTANSAFYNGGEESEYYIQSLTVKDTRASTPIYLQNNRAVAADSVTLINITTTSPQNALITWEHSNGNIGTLTIENCPANDNGCLISIKDTRYMSKSDFSNLEYMNIKKLILNNIINIDKAVSFCFFKRTDTYGDFYIEVNEYEYNNGTADGAYYENFPATEDTLTFIMKGVIASKGTSAERPQKRLCRYYSKYEDTTLGKMLTWTGDVWK